MFLAQPPAGKIAFIVTGNRKGHFESCGCSGVKAITSISREANLIQRTRIKLQKEGFTTLLVDVGNNATGQRHDAVVKDFLKTLRFDYASELEMAKPAALKEAKIVDSPARLEVGKERLPAPNHQRIVVARIGSTVKVEIVEVNADEPLDPTVEALLEKERQKDRDDFFRKMLALASPPPKDGEPEACGKCHAKEYRSWKDTKHAHALGTLIEKDRVIHDCVVCHSTHYRMSRKMVVTKDDPAESISCLSCHDPQGMHRKAPESPYKEEAKESTCLPCHKPENSPKFDFKEYVKRVHP